MTALLVAPAKPRCLICISTPNTGATENSIVLEPEINSYDLVTPSLDGCWTTPSNDTSKLCELGAGWDRL